MREAYPIYLEQQNDKKYLVYVPDFDSYTEGKNMADAIKMARDLIGAMGISLEDENEIKPKPFSNKYKATKKEIMSIVDIDFAEYRTSLDLKPVRKNCTIPKYIEVAAEKKGINFSKVLTEALAVELGISI